MGRFISLWLAILGLTLLATPSANAATYLEEAAAGLQEARVFVSAQAENTTPETTGRLERLLNDRDGIVIAILPEAASTETNGDVQEFARRLDAKLGNKSVVAVAIGKKVAASAAILPTGVAVEQAKRASTVSSNTEETLGTFIANIHDYQRAHPEIKIPAPPSAPAPAETESSSNLGWILIAALAVSFLIVIFMLLGPGSKRTTPVVPRPANPEFDLTSPPVVREVLSGVLALRSQIRDTELRSTITQLAQDIEYLFGELSQSKEVGIVEVNADRFNQNLNSIREVLVKYIRIQDNPRYYPQESLAKGRQSVADFAQHVLQWTQSVSSMSLLEYNVNTELLSTRERRPGQ